jgi:hypothetical protein
MPLIPNVIHSNEMIRSLICHFRDQRAIGIKHVSSGVLLCSPHAGQTHVQRAAKETDMPIRLVVANNENSYLATDAGILIDAFEAALNELGLVDRNDPPTV